MVFPNIYIDNIYKNLEKEPKIYKLANGYILLLGLEQVDCLDKLNEIFQYIKLKYIKYIYYWKI